MLYSSRSTGDNCLMSAVVLRLWNFHSVKMNRLSVPSELETFVCRRTRIGRPPAKRVTVSRIYAGRKCTKRADKRNKNRLGMNFRCGYLKINIIDMSLSMRQRSRVFVESIWFTKRPIWAGTCARSRWFFAECLPIWMDCTCSMYNGILTRCSIWEKKMEHHYFSMLAACMQNGVWSGWRFNSLFLIDMPCGDQQLVDDHIDGNVIVDQVCSDWQAANHTLRGAHQKTLWTVLRYGPARNRFLPRSSYCRRAKSKK